ncbi:organic cation transporter protein-like isoform X2 [Coccinella septempunctata]|nr:organic cation transporter protein-like isoform X2 [Coccinella septempunctata]
MAFLNYTHLAKYIPLKTDGAFESCYMIDPTTSLTIKCHSWVYNTTYHPSSRAIEWNFVCDRRWMGSVSQSIFMFGILIGCIILNNLADRIGRKPVFCWAASICFVSGVCVAFTTQYYLFLFLRFILGMTSVPGTTTGFVLTMELVGPNKRAAVGVGYQAVFACGIILVAFWGYIIKDRQFLQISYGMHALPLILHWWLLDESPRWLWVKGRYQESLEIIEKALKFNGSTKKLKIDKIIPRSESETKRKDASLLDLFKMPIMRKRILIVGFCWFSNSLVYYGLSLGNESMKGNPFMVIFLMGALELPGYVVVIFFLSKLGRRFLIAFNMIISGFCCVLSVSLTMGSIASNVFVYSGKCLIACSYSVIYIHSAELFPTMTRNSAVGFASMCARISGTITPIILLLDSFDPKVPCMIFGVITIFSGYLTLYLPETLGTIMPSTIEEGEKFGNGDTCFTNCLSQTRESKKKSSPIVIEQLEPLNIT